MANIYLSSTFSDLEAYRRRVSTAIRSMGHVDVAMEYYAAGPQRPLERCLADVERCDLYVGIFAFRYGFVPPGRDRSITELEYRRAKEAGKDCIILLLKDGAPWPTDMIEFAAYQKVSALRKDLCDDNSVGFFTNKDDLHAAFTEALHEWERAQGLKKATDIVNWDAYRQSVFDEHRWVRLAVIAGAKQDRIAQVPLTEVFVPQMTKAGRPVYEVPEEVLQFRRDLFAQARPAPDEIGEEEDETDAEEASEEAAEAESVLGEFAEPVLDAFARERTQVVLGGPGSGKSTLLLYAMLMLCDPERADKALPQHLQSQPIPFMVELRQYVLKGMPDFVEYIVGHVKSNYGFRIEAEALRSLLGEDGRTLVFFDGLDEVFDPAEREKAIRMFRAFAREYPRVRIVVTSRIVGYDDKDLGVAMFKHYTLLDFGVGQVRQFVHKWYEFYTWEGDTRDSQGLIQRISESPRLLELAGNPLLLTMMAVIYKHQDLPEQRWLLYQRCTEVLLEDWDIKRKSIDQSTLLPLDINIKGAQKAEILQRVSMYMLEHGQSGRELNAIAYEPLLHILAAYLEQKYSKSRGDAEVLAEEILSHLRERTYILAEVGERVFGFVHRTFMEYFAASYLKAEFNARKADYEWLTKETFGALWRKDEWQEVLLLLIAMLAGQGSPVVELIEFLRRQSTYPPFNEAFAARCLAEAGAEGDEDLAQDLVETLTREIISRAPDLKKKDVAPFVDMALSALSALGPTVTVREKTKNRIDRFEKRGSPQERMIAWRMGLALRSRQERLSYALAALEDKTEAVRRGAIAALEREWPGKLEVGDALVGVVRNDKYPRVRQSALTSLQRAWPDSPAVLDAIAARAKEPSAYTDVIWLMNYLAANWRGNRKALALVIELAGVKLKASKYVYRGEYDTRQAAISAVMRGWDDDPGTLTFLQSNLTNDNRQIRAAAVETILSGWGKQPSLLPSLHGLFTKSPHEEVWRAVLTALAANWRDDPATYSLLLKQAIAGPTAQRRAVVLKGLAGDEPSEPRNLSLLKDRVINDDADEVRAAAVRTLGKDCRESADILTFLLEQAVVHKSAIVRGTCLFTLAGDNFPYKYFLDNFRAFQRTFAHLYVRSEVQPNHPAILPLFRDRAVNDPSEAVRELAIRIIPIWWRDDPQTLQLLTARAARDSSHHIRNVAREVVADWWYYDGASLSPY